MKLAGEAQAELVKWAVLLGGAWIAFGFLRGRVAEAGTWAADAAEKVLAEVEEAFNLFPNGVQPGAGAAAKLPDWTRTRDITPLIAYFQANGNRGATRASALAAGWTEHEISLAVATMGSLNGYY